MHTRIRVCLVRERERERERERGGEGGGREGECEHHYGGGCTRSGTKNSMGTIMLIKVESNKL